MKNGKPAPLVKYLQDSDYSIVAMYGSEYGWYVQYYKLAHNLHSLTKLHWVMATSLLKTLANKHRSTVTNMAAKYRSRKETGFGPSRCFQVVIERGEGKKPLVATFGGLSLKRQMRVSWINDVLKFAPRNRTAEVVDRLLLGRCELCGGDFHVETHHIRKLSDLKKRGRGEPPAWKVIMASRLRKSLVVCRTCHKDIHRGRPLRMLLNSDVR
jgi:hypothetical protein